MNINISHGAWRIPGREYTLTKEFQKNVGARIHTREEPSEMDGSLEEHIAKVS